MATKKQARANQENARRSTGPRTADGKAKSSQNAIKHGLLAQVTVLPDENLDDFEFLVSELEDQFQPQTVVEWNLLRQLADAEWRMRRVPCLEAALFAAKIHETARDYDNFPEQLPEDAAEADRVIIGAATESDASNGDTFSKLSRYEARLSHRYFKALEHLRQIQDRRAHAPAPSPSEPTAPGNHKASTTPPDPTYLQRPAADRTPAAPAEAIDQKQNQRVEGISRTKTSSTFKPRQTNPIAITPRQASRRESNPPGKGSRPQAVVRSL
jgi:hypothetical protein